MRTNGKLAIAWMSMLSGAAACGASHTPCGSDGSYVRDGAGEYCVYSLSQPIVIEGGFSCPPAMRFQMDVGSHRVCSDRALERDRLPRSVCARVGSACSEQAPAMPAMPSTPGPNAPSDGRPDLGSGTMPMSSSMPDPQPEREPFEPRSWSGECNSSGVLEAGLTGDYCPTDIPFGCGTTDRCEANFVMCDPSGILQASDLVIQDCNPDAPTIPEPAPQPWRIADCEDALRDGASFHACEGPFVCAQRTADPCCIEYALCTAPDSNRPNVLVRYSFCELGCGLVEPHPTLEPRDGCQHFVNEEASWPDDLRRADLPCEGDFICWNGEDLTAGASAELSERVGVLRWCSGGIVRGQHSTLSNQFVPSR